MQTPLIGANICVHCSTFIRLYTFYHLPDLCIEYDWERWGGNMLICDMLSEWQRLSLCVQDVVDSNQLHVSYHCVHCEILGVITLPVWRRWLQRRASSALRHCVVCVGCSHVKSSVSWRASATFSQRCRCPTSWRTSRLCFHHI